MGMLLDISSQNVYETLNESRDFLVYQFLSPLPLKQKDDWGFLAVEGLDTECYSELGKISERVNLNGFDDLIDYYSEAVIARKAKSVVIEGYNGQLLDRPLRLRIRPTADVECVGVLASGLLEYRFTEYDHLELDTFTSSIGKGSVRVGDTVWMCFRSFNYLTGSFIKPLSGIIRSDTKLCESSRND